MKRFSRLSRNSEVRVLRLRRGSQGQLQSNFPQFMSPATDLRENREFAWEIKFLVDRVLADQIRDWARGRLAPDPNAAGAPGDAYPIRGLYLDTERFDGFH